MKKIDDCPLKTKADELLQLKTVVLQDIKFYTPETKDLNSCNANYEASGKL